MKKKIICVRIQENVNIKIKINNPFKYCTEEQANVVLARYLR